MSQSGFIKIVTFLTCENYYTMGYTMFPGEICYKDMLAHKKEKLNWFLRLN